MVTKIQSKKMKFRLGHLFKRVLKKDEFPTINQNEVAAFCQNLRVVIYVSKLNLSQLEFQEKPWMKPSILYESFNQNYVFFQANLL